MDLDHLEDHRPGGDDVTPRCWDPDGTEVEVLRDVPRSS
jgi:hypothetical protein